MPARLVLDRRHAPALLRLGDDHRRPARRAHRLVEGRADRLDVVPVDRDRVPAERLRAAHVAVEVPADHGLAGLAEAVDVEDRAEVVELVVARVLERLPHRALGHLGVAAQGPDAVGQAIEPLAGERDADGDRQALAERPGRHVGGRDPRRRVPLQAAAELPERQQLGVVDDPRRLEHRVVERRRMSLGEDQVVVPGVLQVARVHAQEAAVEQHRHQIGGRHRGGGVSGARRRAAADGVHTQLLSELAPAVRTHAAATSASRLASTSANS